MRLPFITITRRKGKVEPTRSSSKYGTCSCGHGRVGHSSDLEKCRFRMAADYPDGRPGKGRVFQDCACKGYDG
jgi:hypothetical protein